MARLLAENERLVQCGTMGYRRPDGSIERSVPIYEIVTVDEVSPKTGMTEKEEEGCADIAKVLAEKMKQYVEGTGLDAW